MCCFSKTIHFQDVCGKSQETFDTCNDCNRQLRWREVRDIRAAQHDIILIHPKKVRTVCYAAAAGTTRLQIAALPIATTTPLRTATTTTVFEWFFPSLKEEADANC